MAKDKKDARATDKRSQAERRREERRQNDHMTTKALFSAYGFKEERKNASRRDDKDRRSK